MVEQWLPGLPGSATTVVEGAAGTFLRFTAEGASARLTVPLGPVAGLQRFTACHRYEPFWMTAKAGTDAGAVPPETQHLLVQREDDYLLLVPLIDGAFRCSLSGAGADGLTLVVESGDPATVTDAVTGLYVAGGPDPFFLLRDGARDIARFLGVGRLRSEKPLPEFINYFGWCTWDAFYQDVSQEKVREGLESFKAGGVQPKYLILDDGWQSVRPFPTGEKRLTGFAANEKFPGDLKPTVTMAKEEYGIQTFLVWHAVGGYWGGVDAEALPGYGVRSQGRQYSEAIMAYEPGVAHWFGTACGVVPSDGIYRFYQDYHRHLREQGVDGVKVDNQASLEGLGQGHGGRVALMRSYREALEGSVAVHFAGKHSSGVNLINCMSCANEMLFTALASNLTRTSTDFWPKKPESHGLHLYVNAQVSAFWGEFVHPDWDMFQSGHEMGAYHAAGRALGGCPVYVSDKPGAHNFDVLRKLVFPNGIVHRFEEPGRPTLDCLFHNPTEEDVLLKIWNSNHDGAAIGVFHARYGEGVGPISGAIRPADIPYWPNPEGRERLFVAHSHNTGELRILRWDEAWPVTLDPLTFDIFTLAPVRHPVAAVGVTDYYNANGVMYYQGFNDEENCLHASLYCGGSFLAYCAVPPVRVTVSGVESPFTFDAATGRLDVSVPNGPSSPLVAIYFQ